MNRPGLVVVFGLPRSVCPAQRVAKVQLKSAGVVELRFRPARRPPLGSVLEVQLVGSPPHGPVGAIVLPHLQTTSFRDLAQCTHGNRAPLPSLGAAKPRPRAKPFPVCPAQTSHVAMILRLQSAWLGPLSIHPPLSTWPPAQVSHTASNQPRRPRLTHIFCITTEGSPRGKPVDRLTR
jgi:hypothetical protein